MPSMNFSIPPHIKEEFNTVFAHENKSKVVVEMMKKAIEEYHQRQKRIKSIDELLKMRAAQPPVSSKKLAVARQEGRP